MSNVYSLEARRRALDERNRLHDQALERAQRLRIEAMDEFIREASAWVGDAASRARRAANRLAARLRQHAKQRAGAARPARASEA